MPPKKSPGETGTFFETHLKSYVAFERERADLMAQFLTRSLGSVWFLGTSIFVILGWIPALTPFDPYPFSILLMMVSFSALLLAIIVLINQNQQGRMADVRQRIDFEVNVRAEHEITKILTMLEALHIKAGISKQDTELDKMKRRIDIVELKEDIEQGIEKEDAGKTRRPPIA